MTSISWAYKISDFIQLPYFFSAALCHMTKSANRALHISIRLSHCRQSASSYHGTWKNVIPIYLKVFATLCTAGDRYSRWKTLLFRKCSLKLERGHFDRIPTLLGQWNFCSQSDRKYSELSVKSRSEIGYCSQQIVLCYLEPCHKENCLSCAVGRTMIKESLHSPVPKPEWNYSTHAQEKSEKRHLSFQK